MKKNKKVLFVRMDKIGDLMLVTPAIHKLKELRPDMMIDALCSEYAAPVLKNNPAIRSILIYEKEGAPFKKVISLIREVKKNNYDIAFVFFVNPISVLIPFLAGIKLRVGPFSKIFSLFLNKRIIQNRKSAEKHEAEYNLELVKSIFPDIKDEIYPEIILSGDEGKAGLELLRKTGYIENKKLAGVHPGGRGSNLLLPKEKYSLIIDYLISKDYFVLLSGLKEELQEYAEKYGSNKQVIIPLDYDLRILAAMISKCDVFITNSTGPLHIASAFGIKTISFFSPIKVTKDTRWGPLYKDEKIKYKVLYPEIEMDCEYCRKGKCRYFNCMSHIRNGRIRKVIDEMIS